jgi:hypothetical protein
MNRNNNITDTTILCHARPGIAFAGRGFNLSA